MSTNTCEWKSTYIFPNHYQISNDGRVKSVRSGKILKPKISGAGYHRVNLSVNGKVRSVFVHRLVAMAFIENPSNKPTVNHINENKTDNRVENLEWATNAEQNSHGTRTERARKHTNYSKREIDYSVVAQKHDYSRGDMCNRKRVLVYKDGNLIGNFGSQREASDFTGVSKGKVSLCISGKKDSCKGFVFKEGGEDEEINTNITSSSSDGKDGDDSIRGT